MTTGTPFALTAWILISVALITVAIVLSHLGHGSDGRWRPDGSTWGTRLNETENYPALYA